jgi:hypothetical protein
MEILSEELYEALQAAAQEVYENKHRPTDEEPQAQNLHDLEVLVQAVSRAGTESCELYPELKETLNRVWHVEEQMQQIILAYGNLTSTDSRVSKVGQDELRDLSQYLQSGYLAANLAVRLLLQESPDMWDKLKAVDVPVELAEDAE